MLYCYVVKLHVKSVQWKETVTAANSTFMLEQRQVVGNIRIGFPVRTKIKQKLRTRDIKLGTK